MGLRSALRSALWTGEKCTQCRRPLEPVDQMAHLSREDFKRLATIWRCAQCGGLSCEEHFFPITFPRCRQGGNASKFEIVQMFRR